MVGGGKRGKRAPAIAALEEPGIGLRWQPEERVAQQVPVSRRNVQVRVTTDYEATAKRGKVEVPFELIEIPASVAGPL